MVVPHLPPNVAKALPKVSEEFDHGKRGNMLLKKLQEVVEYGLWRKRGYA